MGLDRKASVIRAWGNAATTLTEIMKSHVDPQPSGFTVHVEMAPMSTAGGSLGGPMFMFAPLPASGMTTLSLDEVTAA